MLFYEFVARFLLPERVQSCLQNLHHPSTFGPVKHDDSSVSLKSRFAAKVTDQTLEAAKERVERR